MTIELTNFDAHAKEAIKIFWSTRDAARQRQAQSGRTDQGERAGVTAGKNMDGFLDLVIETVKQNGLEGAEICLRVRLETLPLLTMACETPCEESDVGDEDPCLCGGD